MCCSLEPRTSRVVAQSSCPCTRGIPLPASRSRWPQTSCGNLCKCIQIWAFSVPRPFSGHLISRPSHGFATLIIDAAQRHTIIIRAICASPGPPWRPLANTCRKFSETQERSPSSGRTFVPGGRRGSGPLPLPLATRAAITSTLMIVHGLEGSSDSQYVIGTGSKAWQRGWNVVRMNIRNCGGTEKLTPTLYHSGLSEDIRRGRHNSAGTGTPATFRTGRILDGRQPGVEVRRRMGKGSAAATRRPLRHLSCVRFVDLRRRVT